MGKQGGRVLGETLYAVQFEMDGSIWSAMAIVEERANAPFADMIDLIFLTEKGDRKFLIHKFSLRAMYKLGDRVEWEEIAKGVNGLLFQRGKVQFISNVMNLLGVNEMEADIKGVENAQESSGNGE